MIHPGSDTISSTWKRRTTKRMDKAAEMKVRQVQLPAHHSPSSSLNAESRRKTFFPQIQKRY